MSVDGIVERIIADARKEAEQILEKTWEQEQRILEEGEREADAYYERQAARLDERYRREKERAVLNRRLQERKALLEARQVWMDRAFTDAYRKLVDQPDREYAALMEKLIAASSATRDETVVFGTKGDHALLEGIIEKVNRTLGGSFTLAEQRGEFPWGFVLRRGKVETKLSIDSLFAYRRADLEQKAWELFNAG
ncbi:MAG: V-type ATP synthase subunit E [Spirochaetota bacterium]